MGHEFSIYQSDGGIITLVVDEEINDPFLTEKKLMDHISKLEKELNNKLKKNLDDAFGITDDPKLKYSKYKAITPLETEESAKAAISKHIPTIRDKWNKPGGPGERLAAKRFGTNGGTRRFKKKRLMSRKYCKKTPCRRMGFTQKASCRPYKNCY
jgi:phage gpG-like protein